MRYTFFSLFIFCAVIVKAQEYDFFFVAHNQSDMSVYSATKDKKELKKAYKQTPYWKKYKVLKVCGWSAFGLGIGGAATTLLVALGSYPNGNSNKDLDLKPVLYTSIGLAFSSIPLFILSQKNRMKAERAVELSLNTSHICMSLPNGRQQVNPALGLCIKF